MPTFSLSWKGSKRRQSKAGTTSISSTSRKPPRHSLAHRAAEDVFREPLTDSFNDLRRQQRILVRKRRGAKVRFSHSSANSQISATRRQRKQRDSYQSQPSIPRSCVPTTKADESCAEQQLDSGGDGLAVAEERARQLRPQDDQAQAVSEAHRRTPPGRYRFSEMPNPEGNSYWGDLPSSPVPSPQKSGRRRNDEGTPKVPGQTATQANAGANQTTSKEAGRLADLSEAMDDGRGRPLPPAKHYPLQSSGQLETAVPNNTRSGSKKRFGVADPVLWEAIRRSQSQQRRLSSVVESAAISSERTTSAELDLENPSRTSSQSRAVQKFARELERYAAHTHASGRLADFTPTATGSKMSVETIAELLPYRAEFRAAGLAVTSKEQKTPERTAGRPEPSRFAKLAHLRSSGLRMDGDAASPSYQSSESKLSSASTTMHHDGPANDMRYILADELPSAKAPRTGRRHLLHWLHRRSPPKEMAPAPPPHSAKPSQTLKTPEKGPMNHSPGEY
jgi:hypothetical protein